MAVGDQRLSLFALISEFESDARSVVGEFICSDYTISRDIGGQAYEQLLARSGSDPASDMFDERSLLYFLDIGDAVKLLIANRSILPAPLAPVLRRHATDLEYVPQVRNRVMHQRPLEFDDLPTTLDTLRAVSNASPSEFRRTKAAIKLMDTGGVYAAYKGQFAFEATPAAFNNLPLSDYEDTGFLGRREYVDELRKAIAGPYPVVTVLGDGGAGKSALALQVAYDFVNDPNTHFDAVIWTTAKTSRLTSADVQAISGAVETSIGVAEAAACQFGDYDKNDPFRSVKELLSTFKILLFIDNLETILDQKIRDFVRDIPHGSKVVFTSRIGLGAYEYVVKLPNFSPKQSVSYFRRVCTVWRQTQYRDTPDDAVIGICTRLNNSPLGIKWFVQAVSTGAQPQAILASPKTFLAFCLENVVNNLSTDSRTILLALAITAREQSPASLHYLTEIPPFGVEEALRELISSTLITVIASSFGEEDRYKVGSFAQTYIVRHHSPSGAVQAEVRARQARLTAMSERAEADSEHVNFDPVHIAVRRDYAGTDCVAATFLRRALMELRKGNTEEAFGLIEEAKDIAATYFEVLRVEAQVAEECLDLVRARDAFEEALALRPSHAPLRLFFAQFLLRALSDARTAIQVLSELQLEGRPFEIDMELARAHLYVQDYDKAYALLRGLDISQVRSIKVRTKYFDLVCQSCTRDSEKAAEVGDWPRFWLSLVRLSELLDQIPDECIDSHLQEHLRDVVQLERQHAVRAPDGPLKDNAQAAILRTRAILGLPEFSGVEYQEDGGERIGGRISHMHPTFGFVESDGGQRFFFHANNMLVRRDFQRLEHGWPVTFRLGRNAQGVCANEVSPVE